MMQNETTREMAVPVAAVLPALEEGQTSETTATQPPVLGAVFRSIFLDVPKDFFGGIGNFFRRYYLHYKTVFRFFNRPSLSIAPFNRIDFKESSQLSFEIALLLVAALLFMIQQNMVPAEASLQEIYGNDIMQMFMEFLVFVLLALAFFAQLLCSVLLGRLQRILFTVPVSRKQSDTLYCLLNNSFFSISALLAFFLRMGTQYERIKDSGTENGIYVLCFFISFLFVGWWSFRFARLHRLSAGKQLGFHLFSILLFTVLYGTGMSAIVAFILGT